MSKEKYKGSRIKGGFRKALILSALPFFFLFFITFISAWNFETPGGGDITVTTITGNLTNFTDLEDTPSTYSGQGDNCVLVNSGGTALVFGSCSAASGDITSVQGDNIFIYNGSNSGDVTLVFNITKVVDYIGNWSDDQSNYYTSSQTDTEIQNANTSLKDYVDTKFFSNLTNFTGTITDTKLCTYNQSTGLIDCNTDSSGGFITDQNDELNTTGSPTFINVTANLFQGSLDFSDITNKLISSVIGPYLELASEILSINITAFDERYINVDGDNFTGDVSLGDNNITDIIRTVYNIAGCSEDTIEGTVCWNGDDHTINVVTGIGNVIQVGQEVFTIGINDEGSPIVDGLVVALKGAGLDRNTFILADGTNISESNMVGVLTVDCADAAECPVTTFGYVRDIDTSSFNLGDKLYLNPASSGVLTNLKPTLPNNPIWVATVIKKDLATGIIFVFPQIDKENGFLIKNIYATGNITVVGKINGVNISNVSEGPHTGGNSSWNETHADTLYADISVVDTNIIDNNLYNTSQFTETGGVLNILLSEFTNLWNSVFNTKDTDDLSEGSVNLYDNQSWNETHADTLYADISVIGGFTTDQNDELNTTGSPTFDNLSMTGNLTMVNFSIRRLPTNDKIAGDLFSIVIDENGLELPHFGLEEGGDGQANFIVRSFMIVDDVEELLNNTNRTDCQAWADHFGEPLQIDCNTTTTGADLLVGDDQQNFGDFWLKDSDGEWHFLTRDLQLQDELLSNLVLNKFNVTVNGETVTLNETDGEKIVVNIMDTETILEKTSEVYTWASGTNSSPNTNFIYYTNPSNPTLTVGTSDPGLNVAELSRAIIGSAGYGYASYIDDESQQALLNQMLTRFREEGTRYLAGFNQTISSTQVAFDSGNIRVITHLDDKADTYDSSVNFFFVESNGLYTQASSLDDISNYSDGIAISNNRYFNVVFGVSHNDAGENRLLAVVQSGGNEYNGETVAEVDKFFQTNFFPSETLLKQLFTPVARVVMKRTGGVNIIQTLANGNLFLDIRGTVIGSGGAAASPSITEHNALDNLEWNVAGHLFGDVGQVMDIGSYNITTTGNGTFSFIFGDGSQLTGLSSTDTNASTACSGTSTYLDGENNCNDLDSVYILQSNEGNLDVNSSDFWDNFNTVNTTWFENVEGTLNLITSFFETEWNRVFNTKTTDDLTEGSTNLYDNQSWDEPLADTLYADISVTGDNSTWNETHADSKYIQTETDPLWTANQTNYYNKTDVRTTNLNISDANLTLSQDSFFCLNQDCSANMSYNGTHTVWY